MSEHTPLTEAERADDLVRRVADCLERHLPDFGFEPYRYPSGENKSIHLLDSTTIHVTDSQGNSWRLALTGGRSIDAEQAVDRLADQAYHTAGNPRGRERAHEDRATVLGALAARTSTATADTGLRERVEAVRDHAQTQAEATEPAQPWRWIGKRLTEALNATAAPTTDPGARDE